MIRQTLGKIVLLAASIAAGSAEASQPLQLQGIENDQFQPNVLINGADFDAYPVEAIEYHWFLRTSIDKNSRAVVHQIYVETHYLPPKSNFRDATDDTARSLQLRKLFFTRKSCGQHVCGDEEIFGIAVSEEILKARAATGYPVKLWAQDGTTYILAITPEMIQLQLNAETQALQSMGPPPPTPPAPVAVDCGPLGIHVIPLVDSDPVRTVHPALRGVKVTEVDKDSPADKAGITSGDVIMQYDRQDVSAPEELRAAVKDAGGGMIGAAGVNKRGIPWMHDVRMPGLSTSSHPSLASLQLGLHGDMLDTSDPISQHNHKITGMKISRIDPGSISDQIGLVPGDVIIACDGKPIRKPEDLSTRMSALRHQESVALTVIHADATERSTYTLRRP